jgi:BirA family biotin operon repressor/biotin-[acetyl-CoA-carboxylase] ligase
MDRAALLAALAAAPGGVSGTALAARFGVSRGAVWKAIEALRGDGLDIEGNTGRGYRLTQPLDLLDRTRLVRALSLHCPDRVEHVEVHWRIDSTSSELRRRLSAGDRRRQLLLAETQSAGRGRLGRGWHSPAACNLYLSLAWRMVRPAAALGGLSLALGVAVAETLIASGVDGLTLKWPNDVLRDGRKLGGLLVELGGELDGPCDLVIGLGLNLRMPPAAAVGIEQPWNDLRDLPLPPRSELAAALVAGLIRALDAYDASGFAPFLARFEALDGLRGMQVSVTSGACRMPGVVLGVDADGGLRVAHPEGERVHRGGEVSLR